MMTNADIKHCSEIKQIQRYEPYISSICTEGCGSSMDDKGDYVLFSDHEKEVKALEKRIEAQNSYIEMLDDVICKRDELINDLRDACRQKQEIIDVEKQQETINTLRTEIEYYEDMVKVLCCSGVIVKTYAEKDTVTDFEKLCDSIDEALEKVK